MKTLEEFPRFPVSDLPTPLIRASRLEASLGPDSPRIWIKRDDLTGLAFGGNKARKLDYLVGDALAQGATFLVTEGGVQSNHARMTAAAAVLAGMGSALVLDTRRAPVVDGNLLLDTLLGAEIHLVQSSGERKQKAQEVMADLADRGELPYFLPTGGSVPIGALGYVQAFQEMQGQWETEGFVPTRIYTPTGSQGTLAGLLTGLALSNLPTEIYGVAVEYPKEELIESAHDLLQETLALLDAPTELTLPPVMVDDGFVGEGYGIPTPAGLDAINRLARTEALFLDPVYSGKAMSALLHHVESGLFRAEDHIVFLHTGGGPSVFAYREELAHAG